MTYNVFSGTLNPTQLLNNYCSSIYNILDMAYILLLSLLKDQERPLGCATELSWRSTRSTRLLQVGVPPLYVLRYFASLCVTARSMVEYGWAPKLSSKLSSDEDYISTAKTILMALSEFYY